MSWAKFDEHCKDCEPALLDVKTGEVMAADSEIMRAVNAAWEELSLEDKQAWHRVSCLNSRSPFDLHVCQRFTRRIEALAARLGQN